MICIFRSMAPPFPSEAQASSSSLWMRAAFPSGWQKRRFSLLLMSVAWKSIWKQASLQGRCGPLCTRGKPPLGRGVLYTGNTWSALCFGLPTWSLTLWAFIPFHLRVVPVWSKVLIIDKLLLIRGRPYILEDFANDRKALRKVYCVEHCCTTF